MTNQTTDAVLTHVTHGQMDDVMIYAPRGAGKVTAREVSHLIAASENVLACVQDGSIFASDEKSIAACAEATDLLEESIHTLKAKGF
jgi:hypothetical protein